MNHCSLQINLAPNDYLHARYILPHQIGTLIDQVDEVVLTLDTHRSKGRFGANWEENLAHMQELIRLQCLGNSKVRFSTVDYSAPVMEKIAAFFFGGGFIPKKDYRGGPFYSYFYGLYDCKSDYILHLDADIFLGGGSQAWINEATDLLSSNENVFTCSPLPGPPHPQKILVGQPAAIKTDGSYRFKFKGMSTRIFMIKRNVFEKQKLELSIPAAQKFVKAVIKGNPAYNLPEDIISAYMSKHCLERIDFLGSGDGIWSLHPPYRTASFYNGLPQLINGVVTNTLDPLQDGFYDIVDEVCDWTEARQKLKKSRWWKKILLPKSAR